MVTGWFARRRRRLPLRRTDTPSARSQQDADGVEIKITNDPDELVRLARSEFGVRPLRDLQDAVAWLKELGASEVPPDLHPERFHDEYVDRDLVAINLTIRDPEMIRSRAARSDHLLFDSEEPDEDEVDSLHFGPEREKETIFSREIGWERLLITLESRSDDLDAVGNFRVHGAGHWLREALWAGTGVVPRDSGGADSDFYGDAFVLAGRTRFESLPIPGWKPLP